MNERVASVFQGVNAEKVVSLIEELEQEAPPCDHPDHNTPNHMAITYGLGALAIIGNFSTALLYDAVERINTKFGSSITYDEVVGTASRIGQNQQTAQDMITSLLEQYGFDVERVNPDAFN